MEASMTLRGHMRSGTLIFDEPPPLPDGIVVEVELRTVDADESGPTLYQRYSNIVGIAEGLPEDFSINHDHYIHGTPKREFP
jgi:hypothetical protein